MEQTVFLFRHGEVEARYSKCCRGVTDAALSEDGERVSQRNAAFVAAQRVDLVVTSGLSRSDRVGKLAAELGIAHEVEPRFQERDFGDWEGQAWDDIAAAFPKERALMGRYEEFLPPRGESQAQLDARVAEGWGSILARPLVRMAIVGHGFMNVALLSHVQRIKYGKMKQEKGGVTVIRLDAGRVVEVTANLMVGDDLTLIPVA